MLLILGFAAVGFFAAGAILIQRRRSQFGYSRVGKTLDKTLGTESKENLGELRGIELSSSKSLGASRYSCSRYVVFKPLLSLHVLFKEFTGWVKAYCVITQGDDDDFACGDESGW